MDAERFVSFWEELRQCLGGHTEWTRHVTSSDEGQYVVMLHILTLSPQGTPFIGGRLAVMGGSGNAHGFWILDIDATTLRRFVSDL